MPSTVNNSDDHPPQSSTTPAAPSDERNLAPFPSLGAAYRRGAIDAWKLPAVMIAATTMGYGPLARDNGFALPETVISCLTVWGLPGQVAMVELFGIGAPLLVVILASSVANARFLPMVVSALPLCHGDGRGVGWRLLYAQVLSVNTWVGLQRKAPVLPVEQRGVYYLGFATSCMLGAVLGASVGFQAAEIVPPWITVSLIFLNPIYFAFIFASSRQRKLIFSMLFGVFLGPALHLWSSDWGVLAAGALAGTLGFLADRWLPGPADGGRDAGDTGDDGHG